MPTWIDNLKRAALAVEAGPFTAVDIDGDQIRVVYGEHRGLKTKIVRLDSVAIPEGVDVSDAKAIGELLGKLVRPAAERGKGLVFSVPRSRVVLQPMRLPTVATDPDLANMVRFQAEKELAFSPEEAVIDYAVESHYDSADAGGAEAQGVDVLVAAVKLPVIEYYRKVAEAAKLKLLRLTLRPYASTCCLLDAAAVGDKVECLALAHIGADEVEIDVVVGRSLAFSRSIGVKIPHGPTPGADPGEGSAATGAEVAESLITDVARTLKSYQAVQRDRQIVRVIVAGGTGLEEAVVHGLGEEMGVPAERFHPEVALRIRDKNHDASAFIAALGLALGYARTERLPFDFLNPKKPPIRRDNDKIRRNTLMGVAGGLAAAMIIAGLVVLSKKEAQVKSLKFALGKLKEKNASVVALQKRANNLDGWVDGTTNWLDQWTLLSATFPDAKAVYLTGFRTASDGSMVFTVRAHSDADITDINRRLEKAGYACKTGQVSARDDALGYDHTADVSLVVTRKVKFNVADLTVPPRPADDISAEPSRGRGRQQPRETVQEPPRETPSEPAPDAGADPNAGKRGRRRKG